MDQQKFFERYNIDSQAFERSGLTWQELMEIKSDYEANQGEYKLALDYLTWKLIACPDVNSFKYRLKEPEHLIEKIIRKRILEPSVVIDFKNYRERITDLIGVRVLHLFKNDWQKIGAFINQEWKYIERPVIYIRAGDNSMLSSDDYQVKEHWLGYRSIHYMVTLNLGKSSYIAEIQVRTIFEEAWSEIDHKLRYPYYTNNELLESNSLILNRLAGAADEFATNLVKIKDLIDETSQAEFNDIKSLVEAELNSHAETAQRKPLKIILSENAGKATMESFKKIAIDNEGNDKVYLRIPMNGADKVIEIGYRVNNTPELIRLIKYKLGDQMRVIE